MSRKILVAVILIIGAGNVFSQNVTFSAVKQQFESFEYQNVLKLSDELLKKEELTDSLKIDIYLMRAVSSYSLANLQETRKSFNSILLVNRYYTPSSSVIAPLLISIFDEVKTEYLRNNPDPTQPQIEAEKKHSTQIMFPDTKLYKNSLVKNIVIPGWGQTSLGNTSKGLITMGLFVAASGVMINSISNANTKEHAYLNETNSSLVMLKYNEYNSAYKNRNLMISAVIAIWLYSQIDILLFTDEPMTTGTPAVNSEVFYNPSTKSFQLSMRFGFR